MAVEFFVWIQDVWKGWNKVHGDENEYVFDGGKIKSGKTTLMIVWLGLLIFSSPGYFANFMFISLSSASAILLCVIWCPICYIQSVNLVLDLGVSHCLPNHPSYKEIWIKILYFHSNKFYLLNITITQSSLKAGRKVKLNFFLVLCPSSSISLLLHSKNPRVGLDTGTNSLTPICEG